MVAYGTHEVESYLVKSNQLNKDNISRPWDILKPKTQLEEGDSSSFYSYDEKKNYTLMCSMTVEVWAFFLKVFGYNSNPNYIELVMWIMSLVYGLNLWRRFLLLI